VAAYAVIYVFEPAKILFGSDIAIALYAGDKLPRLSLRVSILPQKPSSGQRVSLSTSETRWAWIEVFAHIVAAA